MKPVQIFPPSTKRTGKPLSRILLVAPDFNPETKTERNARFANHHKGAVVPLGLATVAALTPDGVEVDLWDEAIHETITPETDFGKEYDLVGVTGYETHIRRQRELGAILRGRGFTVAVGGPGVSAAPEQYREHFDILFIGEAEYTWPQFIAEWRAGGYRTEYRQVAKVDMTHSPAPRWDKIAGEIGRYRTAAVQTTRGCPFDCEFCNVTYIFGRQARHKTVEQVLVEVRALEALGARKISFHDDNFIGNPGYARSLLKELAALNRSFRKPLSFFTSVTLNIAKCEDILELLVEANFSGIFIGIESPNIESLVETNKPQNYKTDIVADVHRIQSYGLPIEAGMIVGFDHDDATIFDRQFAFLQEACIVKPYLNMLSAPVGTHLWNRLHREGRVLDLSSGDRSARDAVLASIRTNIVPKQMTRVELLSGYRSLVKRVRDWRNFEARVMGMVAGVRPEALAPRAPAAAARRRKGSWLGRLKQELGFWSFMSWEGRFATLRMLRHTRRHAPAMANTVKGFIKRQATDAANLPRLLAAIDGEIRRETVKGRDWQRERRAFLIPEAFKKPFKEVFPELHERVYRGLADKSRTHNALVEVTYAFLTRWGPEVGTLEAEHLASLWQAAEETLAKENAARPVAAVAPGALPEELSGPNQGQVAMKLRRLADEVLRAAEQELRALGQPDTALPVLHSAGG
ncbi:MAG TPA: radical SAM protein [Longimicrobiaceae bacterium]|nr:radical SAM protein [Longimicrobiaceae bacterium]